MPETGFFKGWAMFPSGPHKLVGWSVKGETSKIVDSLSTISAYSKVVQVHSTTANKLDNVQAARIESISREADRCRMRLIWHMPYCTSFANPERQDKRNKTVKFLVDFLGKATSCSNAVTIVVHPGIRKRKRMGPHDKGEVFEYGRRSLFGLSTSMSRAGIDTKRLQVCIENEPHSRILFGPSGKKLRTYDIADEWVESSGTMWLKSCFDTEHAWFKNGGMNMFGKRFDDKDFNWFNVGVVHMNAIPRSPTRKSTDTLLQDSLESQALWRIMAGCKDRKIPMILERSSTELVLRDLVLIKGRWGRL